MNALESWQARDVLAVFAKMDRRPGDSLPVQTFWTVLGRGDVVAAGLQWLSDTGYVTLNDPETAATLTEAGYHVIAGEDPSAKSGAPHHRYEAVPFQFYTLHKSFAKIPGQAVAFARKLFVGGDEAFQFEGGRLLASSFPDYGESFAGILESYVPSGKRDDIDFVVQVMSSYHGDVSLNATCRAVVRALPGDDRLLSSVEIVLQNTGVVSGEFGMVQAYQAKRQEMLGWLGDPDERVRTFAESYVRLLDRQIAAEQRRSEESIEIRKRKYGDPDSDGAT